jgi:hypothetical protein
MTKQPKRQFVVVCQAETWVRTIENDPFMLSNVPSYGEPVNIVCRTHFSDEGFSAPLPRQLIFEIYGKADSIEEAQFAFANAANSIIPVISFSTNAYIDWVQVELAYETTPDKTEKQFLQICLTHKQDGLKRMRRLHKDATVALMQTLETHTHKIRLLRGIGHYHLALSRNILGQEIPMLSHLWIGMETITEVAVHEEIRKAGLNTKDELAKEWGFDTLGLLDAKVRKSILFQNDKEAYKSAKKASDSYEHGFLTFEDIRKLAEPVTNTVASYLRTAILDLLAIDTEAKTTLISEPYNMMFSLLPIQGYIRGYLVSQVESLAAPGYAHPCFDLKHEIDSVERNDKNGFNILLKQPKWTKHLNKEVEFKGSYEIREALNDHNNED